MGELSTIDQSKALELAAILGTSEKASSDRLPQLKVNTKRKDPQGRKIEEGMFFVTDQDENVYSETVRIRVLSQLFQWIHYDQEKNKVVNKTILIPKLRDEARDMKGGTRCGKPASKVLRELPKEEQKKYTDIKCFRQLRVLVSYTGKTADGDEVTVENLPAVMLLKGSNFSPFEDEFIKVIPRNNNYYDFWCDVTLEELTNGSVTYYVNHYKPDLTNPVAMDEDTFDTMVGMGELVKAENTRIENMHLAAMRNDDLSDDAIEAVIDAAPLEDDLEDEG